MILNNSDEIATDGVVLEAGNPALADAMRKVLSIGKNAGTSSIILAKAKLDSKDKSVTKKVAPSIGFEIETVEPKDDFSLLEVKEDVKDIKPDISLRKRIKKQEVAAQGRIKPSPLDREQERPLSKIATRGVVQLFNAVREQQKVIDKKLEEAGPSETKKEKALKSVDRKSFLDVLRGCSERKKPNALHVEEEVKDDDEPKGRKEPSWSVLRDDFMMGAKLKDWDKKEREAEAPTVAKRRRR